MMTSLRHKLWLGFGGMLAVLLVVSALSVIVLTLYSEKLGQLFHDNYNSVVYCDAMKAALDQLDARAQRLVWGGDSTDPAPFISAFDSNLQLQFKNITLKDEREQTQKLSSLWDDYKTQYSQLTGPGEQQANLYRQKLLPNYFELKQTAQHVADMNMANMASVDSGVKTTMVDVRNTLLFLVVVGTLLAAAVVWTAGAAILRPITILTRSAREIEKGNLDLTVPSTSRDEVGQLAEAFNSMAARLRQFRQVDAERLARTQQTTQLAVDSLPDAVFVIGPDGAIEISNRTAASHFNIKPRTTIAGLGLPWLSDLYERAVIHQEQVEPQGYKSAIQFFDAGQERFLLPRAVPMLDSRKKLIGATVILVDVTRLRQMDEMKSGLISTASHELRTPLTSIRMSLLLLADEKLGALSPRQKQMMTAARDESDRLYRTIENLLNISRIEAGRARYQFQRLNPKEIVSQAVDPLRAGFADKNLQLDVAMADKLPDVMADPAALVSALTNLLTNALKFTPAKGYVRVAIEMHNSSVIFSVTDTGPGIPQQYHARIFEKFFRVPSPSGPTGAGLGLSIVKEIIDAHSGHVGFQNGPDGGCSFRFTLPAA